MTKAAAKSKLGNTVKAKPAAKLRVEPGTPSTRSHAKRQQQKVRAHSKSCHVVKASRDTISAATRAALLNLPAPPQPLSVTLIRGKASDSESSPLVEEKRWPQLPTWVALYSERGQVPLCFFGHELVPSKAPNFSSCYKCGLRPIPRGHPVLWCRTCDFWSLCAECAVLPRLPSLRDDPLFHAPDDPGVIMWTSAAEASKGTVIVCPGGNYEFLCPNEAEPVVTWLAHHGIHSIVLRYRLLPKHRLDDALEDLSLAVDHVRRTRDGPVIAMGFSAGGHLIASAALQRTSQGSHRASLDGQVLVYAGINGSDWLDPNTCGFFDWEQCIMAAPCLVATQPSLLGGPGFSAPPSFLVYSIYDSTCPPEKHGDRYAEALRDASIPYTYLRDDYGDHGFGIEGGWTDECISWLQKLGVGAMEQPPLLQVSSSRCCSVSEILVGMYALDGKNHDRPVYKKQITVNGADVSLFFWDCRNGAHWSGWWFAPEVGWGHAAWAYSNRRLMVPPPNGWRIPIDGPVGDSLQLSFKMCDP